MFKKSLAAVAVLGAFATSALAADVTVYGVVDYGMLYQHSEENQEQKTEKTDDLTLDSGINAASRFGIKGSEELGNGYTISFQLENGFKADSGNMNDSKKLFDREARLTVSSAWGELSAGRMGALGSSAGTYDTVYAIGDAFDGGDNDLFTGVMTDRYDNMLTYRSPKVAGLQATAQYSLKTNNDIKNDQHEGHNSADRYAGFAVTGEYGNLQAVASYEQMLYSDLAPNPGDMKITSLGANYDFGIAKLFAMGQYFENGELSSLGEINNLGRNVVDGYALHTGLQMPISTGTLTAGIYYSDADAATDSSDNYQTIVGSVKYEYPLSARTMLYGSMGYGELKNDYPGETDKYKLTQVYAGIQHAF